VSRKTLPHRAKRQKDPIYLRVEKGALVPANEIERERLRKKGYQVGDILRAELRKPRNPRHHRLVMGLIAKLVENFDGLQTVDQALTIIKIKLGRAQPYTDASTMRTYWVPESINFENMDQGDFEEFWRDLCALVVRDFWPDMTPERVTELAEMMDA
jgi:hypothetical protein